MATNDSAYEEGRRAFEGYERLAACPYPDGQLRTAWEAGWTSAQQEQFDEVDMERWSR